MKVRFHDVTVSQPTSGSSPRIHGSPRSVSRIRLTIRGPLPTMDAVVAALGRCSDLQGCRTPGRCDERQDSNPRPSCARYSVRPGRQRERATRSRARQGESHRRPRRWPVAHSDQPCVLGEPSTASGRDRYSRYWPTQRAGDRGQALDGRMGTKSRRHRRSGSRPRDGQGAQDRYHAPRPTSEPPPRNRRVPGDRSRGGRVVATGDKDCSAPPGAAHRGLGDQRTAPVGRVRAFATADGGYRTLPPGVSGGTRNPPGARRTALLRPIRDTGVAC